MAIKDSVTTRLKKPEKIYSISYLEGFGESIKKYRKNYTLVTGEVINVLDWDEIYFRAGVKTKNGRLTWYLDGNGNKVFNMTKFEEVRSQYNAMVAGRNYAEDKKLEDLDKTAHEIDAEKVFADY